MGRVMKKLSAFILVYLLVGSPAYGAALVAAQPTTTCNFEKIKKMVGTSMYRLTPDEWNKQHHVKKLEEWDNHPANRIIGDRTFCGTSADYIVHLMTGMKENEVYDRSIKCELIRATKLSLPLDNNEYYDGYNDFIALENNIFNHQLAQQLFNTSSTPQHLLFFINLFDGGHVFVVEKINNTYRIYQSYFAFFTLAEWLGIDIWHATDARIMQYPWMTECHQNYGQGRLISQDQLIDFLDILTKKISGSARIYVKMFDLGHQNPTQQPAPLT